MSTFDRFEGDSKHEIAEDVILAENAFLHRFNNKAGVPYSAIYVDGSEIWSIDRTREELMVSAWNDMHKLDDAQKAIITLIRYCERNGCDNCCLAIPLGEGVWECMLKDGPSNWREALAVAEAHLKEAEDDE